VSTFTTASKKRKLILGKPRGNEPSRHGNPLGQSVCAFYIHFRTAVHRAWVSDMKTKIILGKKSTWWNRQLKGWWVLGGPIGFFIGGILTSAWLRWSLLLLSVLGCLFAIGFRLARGRDEI
jgi:hypothetical protein